MGVKIQCLLKSRTFINPERRLLVSEHNIIKKIPPINIFPTKREVEIGDDVYGPHRYFSGDKSITQDLEQYIINKSKFENKEYQCVVNVFPLLILFIRFKIQRIGGNYRFVCTIGQKECF